MAHTHSHEPHTQPQGTVEPDAINIGGILRMTLGLVVVTALAHVAMYFTFIVMARQIDASNPPRMFPTAALQDDRQPPEPRLQTTPKEDLANFRAEEDARVNGYHWVDRNRNLVRIPVSEAMRLTLLRGLPARGAAQATSAPEQEQGKEQGK